MAQTDGQLKMEGADIIFRNFSGKEGMYNAEGDRNFCVLLPTHLEEQLRADGWNIKTLRARDEDETPQAYLQVSVKFRGKDGSVSRPPLIVMITSKGRSTLPEEMCEILDWVDIANVDLMLRPYQWAVNGKSGIKAYLKSIYITIEEDDLQRKYADLPELDAHGQLAIESNGGGDYIDGEVVNVHDEDQKALA